MSDPVPLSAVIRDYLDQCEQSRRDPEPDYEPDGHAQWQIDERSDEMADRYERSLDRW